MNFIEKFTEMYVSINVHQINVTAGKPWTESINQSIGCQICRAKGRQPRFNAQVALHNYVNTIIRDTVPQKNLLGNVEITVIRAFFIYHRFILTVFDSFFV